MDNFATVELAITLDPVEPEPILLLFPSVFRSETDSPNCSKSAVVGKSSGQEKAAAIKMPDWRLALTQHNSHNWRDLPQAYNIEVQLFVCPT
jgi:hypothetical protein